MTAWRALGESCGKYLAKGRKVAVTGSVSVNTYTAQDGSTRASMEVVADDVEFLSPKSEFAPGTVGAIDAAVTRDQQTGLEQVDDDGLPF